LPPTPPKLNDAAKQPATVTGVQLMQGLGVQEARGFWADAWAQVLKQPRAVAALAWLSLIVFFAVFAPVLASGHPLIQTLKLSDGTEQTTSPLLRSLTGTDWVLIGGALLLAVLLLLPKRDKGALSPGGKIGLVITTILQGIVTVGIASIIRSMLADRDIVPWLDAWRKMPGFEFQFLAACAVPGLIFAVASPFRTLLSGLLWCGFVAVVGGAIVFLTPPRPPDNFEMYRTLETSGQARMVYTVVPFSPTQRETNLKTLPPGSDATTPLRRAEVLGEMRRLTREAMESPAGVESINAARAAAEKLAREGNKSEGYVRRAIDNADAEARATISERVRAEHEARLIAQAEANFPNDKERTFLVGTDKQGQDVISQMMHACRLSISIGLVSTGIAVLIGVTIGALMGYFGGWVDALLFRVVETFMAIPVLFVLIVAAGVLPRNTYVMMAIIGCVTWTGAARFTRAEFLRLRNQDFVQAAQAAGLPLRSVLFRHMLPNGVTPVLVDASFTIAAAVQIEAILSFLALGPTEQASWGRLLASSSDESGEFLWWLATIPGFAIFFTALAYNLIGESLRDAIDPKLRKARV
jgi:ABC-type dipeptide/oligopeptide/nickel transport system permease subunit